MGCAPHLAYQEMVTVFSHVNQGLCSQKVRYRLLQTALAEAVLPGAGTVHCSRGCGIVPRIPLSAQGSCCHHEGRLVNRMTVTLLTAARAARV